MISKNPTDHWGYGAQRPTPAVNPSLRVDDGVVRLESGRWAPRGDYGRAIPERLHPRTEFDRNGRTGPEIGVDPGYESARARRRRLTNEAATKGLPVGDHDRSDLDPSPHWGRTAIEWAAVLVVSVLVALLVQRFVVQQFSIPSSSMETTLIKDDRLFVEKLGYRFKDINRGDVVVFNKTEAEILARPSDPKHIIKRVIGLPGETVLIANNQVMIDGRILLEPYLETNEINDDFGPFDVPDNHLFMMGDNRTNSADSRYGLGPVAEDRVVGRAFVLWWPISRAGGL